jgi:3',5'-cyclic-nucleotide phosphodiesterase
MKLQVLGCAGGIGGQERHTTCLWLDGDILLDAGTGIANLTLDQLAGIDHVFLTHCHLDHVAGLALLADAVLGRRTGPVIVHASEQVTERLKQHLFNWVLWPDFAAIPDAGDAVLRWAPFRIGDAIAVGGRRLVSHAVNHTEGSVAYAVHDAAGASESGFLFTGDMCSTPALWAALAMDGKLGKVIVDCSFPDAEAELAARSKHFCPRSLLADIAAVPQPVAQSIEFLIYHLKPGQEEQIMKELHAAAPGRAIRALKSGDVFMF